MPTDYEKEKWSRSTRRLFLELEHAKITGRIGDTRTELAARVEKLRDLPGLHVTELHAIDEARRMLLLWRVRKGSTLRNRKVEPSKKRCTSCARLLPRFRS